MPLQAPEAAAAELEAMMANGFSGIEIATTVRGKALDLAGLDAVWEVAESAGTFILLHPMTPSGRGGPGALLHGQLGWASCGIFGDTGRPHHVRSVRTLSRSEVLFGPRWRVYALPNRSPGHEFPRQAGPCCETHLRPPSEFLHQLYVDTVVNEPNVFDSSSIPWAQTMS